MRPLVIIKSCHRHAARREAVAATWLPSLKWDRMFAVGLLATGTHLDTSSGNVIQFPVSDAFKDIAPKLAAALAWGLRHNYTNFFVCDDDTYVVPSRLMNDLVHYCAREQDYLGYKRQDGGALYPWQYIQGSAFWLSARAAKIVAGSPRMCNGIPDDVAVGAALMDEVEFVHDSAYSPGPVPPPNMDGLITAHKCLPEDMRRIHAAYVQHQH